MLLSQFVLTLILSTSPAALQLSDPGSAATRLEVLAVVEAAQQIAPSGTVPQAASDPCTVLGLPWASVIRIERAGRAVTVHTISFFGVRPARTLLLGTEESAREVESLMQTIAAACYDPNIQY